MNGRFHRAIEAQHQIYGNVVRISPNEVSFASCQSWRDIYQSSPGKAPFIKSEFYEIFGAGFKSSCIGSERNPNIHSRMRRCLQGAFSTQSLMEQEGVLQYRIDKFVRSIQSECMIANGADMTKKFEMIAFDVLGEMAFGESFGCIDQGLPHPWQQMIGRHLFFITVVDNLRRYPFARKAVQWLLPKLTIETQRKHSALCRAKIAHRLSTSSNRSDFLTPLIKKVEEGEMSREELTAHASTLVLAGGETVSTFLAATTFHLCKNTADLIKLRNEVRMHFANYNDISARSTLQLPFLQAVIQEGLRIFPPGSQGFPRLSPGAVVDGIWIPKATEVYSSAWTITHSRAHFARPDDFIPARWLDPASSDLKDASQPFSLGSRGCIGRNFANIEMSLILAKIHYVYDTHLLDPNLDWEKQSRLHVQWWKPELRIRFEKVNEMI